MGVPNNYIHIIMRMDKNPKVDALALDEIFQFHSESTVCQTVGKHWTLHPEGRYMMGDHNLLTSCAGFDGLLHESKTPLVFLVEIGKG